MEQAICYAWRSGERFPRQNPDGRFYDGYLYWRDGQYGPLWLPNLFVSPYLYAAAGLLWNLEPGPGRWPSLSFLRTDWPAPPAERAFRPLLPLAVPFVAFGAAVLLLSVRWKV